MSLDRMLRPLPTVPLVMGDEPDDQFSEGVEYVEDEDGSITIDFAPMDIPELIPHGDNLAEYLEETDLDSIASELKAGFHSDKQSRKEWERTLVDGLELLGLKIEDRTEPWDGACGVFHPILGESVVRFQAQTIQEIFPARGPVKTKVYGNVDRDKEKKAERVREYMNYLLTERMSEYRTETERLLFNLPLEGSAFRKVYYDPTLNRPASMFVPAQDFVVSYGAADLETATRTTHIMKKDPNEVRKLQYSGFYRDVELPEPSTDYSDISRAEEEMTGLSPAVENDHRYTLLEMCVRPRPPGLRGHRRDWRADRHCLALRRDHRPIVGDGSLDPPQLVRRRRLQAPPRSLCPLSVHPGHGFLRLWPDSPHWWYGEVWHVDYSATY